MSLKEIRYMIIGYIIFNVIFVYLQYIHVLGGIYSHGYISDVSTRISGLTGGSWELPAVLAMLVSASITDDYYKKRRMILFLIIITSTIMAYLSGTRTGMIVYLLGIGFALIGKYKINIQVILALFVIGYIFINQDRMLVMTKDGQLPYSMEIRLFAWNEYFSKMDYGDYLFGKGLGYSGLHVDGMYSKVFIDMGILGIIIYLCFYIRLLYNYKVIGLIVMLYCITIDFFTASKLMFGMYLGLYYMQQQSKLTIRN